MPDKWDQVKEILGLALEREPAQRTSFIRQACAGDETLRAEVESLASHHEGADSLLENSPAASLFFFEPNAMAGRKVGAYRILRVIGSGGMAVVYMGERDDDAFRKLVAIKMVRPGPGGGEIYHRFRNERQTLAAIDHPNIVKLLDGGSTDDGLPYLVMEFVDGTQIDQYCDLHQLSIEQRLQLFRTVCSAVQYAHEKLIIHRDLKPANILVTKEGVVRLLDFGIAKLLDPGFVQAALITQTNWRPMTPEYASPEQVRGQSVTTSSDVYSLGVLLYELLTGQKPYRSTAHSLLEVERAICDEETEKPSTAVTHAPTLPGVEANRGLEPGQLRRRLQGDLDTITLKALRKEAQNRYASAAEFSSDIDRYLNAKPVAARKRTLAYRGARFIRRHKESVATAIIFLLLIASLIFWEARSTWKQIPEQGSSQAHSSARTSLAILGFKNLSGRADTAWVSTALSEMLATELSAGEKLRTVPVETVARTKLDLSLPDTDSLAADTLARLRKNLGSDLVVLGSYLDLGNGGQVRVDLRLQDTLRGETVATVSETGTEADLSDLVSRSARKLRQQLGIPDISQFDATGIRASVPSNPEAMRLYAEGLAKLRTFDALGARNLLLHAVDADPSYPMAHAGLARAWMALGYNQNAVTEAKKALDLAGKLSREDHALVEARYYEASKDWEKAIDTYRALFAFFPDNLEYGLYLTNAQIGGERSNDALNTLARLRGLFPQARSDPRVDLAEAEAAFFLSDNKRVLVATDNAVIKANASGANLLAARARALQSRALANLGQSQQSLAAGAEARRLYRQAGDLGGEAQALHSMAEVPLNQGDLEQAKQLYEQALELARKVGDQRAAGRELGNIGLIFIQQGDFATGEKFYNEALVNFREVGDKHLMSVVTGNMGDIRHAEGRLGEALAEYRDALVLAREVGHRASEAIDLQLIGDVLADQGDLNGAMQMYQQASAIQRDIGDKTYYSETLASIGRLRRQKADSDGAKKAYEEARAIRQQLGEKGLSAEINVSLGELACDSGQAALAEKLAREAIQEYQAEKETDSELQAQSLLIAALLQQGKTGEAEKAVARGLALFKGSSYVTVRLPFTLQNAYATAAAGNLVEAERMARDVRMEADKFGLVPNQLEASLALGRIRNSTAQLTALARTARARGFELVARKAAAAAQAGKRH